MSQLQGLCLWTQINWNKIKPFVSCLIKTDSAPLRLVACQGWNGDGIGVWNNLIQSCSSPAFSWWWDLPSGLAESQWQHPVNTAEITWDAHRLRKKLEFQSSAGTQRAVRREGSEDCWSSLICGGKHLTTSRQTSSGTYGCEKSYVTWWASIYNIRDKLN